MLIYITRFNENSCILQNKKELVRNVVVSMNESLGKYVRTLTLGGAGKAWLPEVLAKPQRAQE